MSLHNESHAVREPLFRISKRAIIPRRVAWMIRILSFIAALAANALFVYIVIGIDPIELYTTMWQGAFGNSIYRWATFVTAAKLLCIAVALAPAFKMRFWNTGAEGQVLAGGMMAAFVMYNFSNLPTPILFATMIVSSIIVGGIWGMIPAIFKAKFNTNETLFTLMMNYIAMKIVDYFYNSWKGSRSSLGQLNKGTKAGWLRSLWSNSTENGILQKEDFWFILIVLIITVLMFFYLKKTKQGYEIAVVGESQNTARYAGMSVSRVMIRTMFLSGAICGLCGFLTVSAQSHTISSNSAGGFGFTAIIVAWLSKFNTIIMIGVSLLIIALKLGTELVANTYSSVGFSTSASEVVVGILLLFIIGGEFFINYRIVFRKKSAKEAN